MHCIFHVAGAKISRIALHLSKRASFTWEVAGNLPDQETVGLIEGWMEVYLQGREREIQLPLDWKGVSPFTKQVLMSLQQIPFGSSLCYEEVAIRCGKPKASRAVGGACGRNPFLLVVPCHRVLAKGGALGGFSSGLEIKKQLLAFEKCPIV